MGMLIRTLLVLFLLSACRGKPPAPAPDIGQQLMPKGATMVVNVRGDDPNVWERSFTVPATYPALGIADDAFARIKTGGWKSCESEQDKWSEWVDKSRATPATVYQRFQYWRHGNDVLKITYRYRVEHGGEPTMQRVTLSFHGAQTGQNLERWNVFFGPCSG